MTKYIKTGTTEFEQFDGSDDQCFKFGIIDKANLTSVESVAYGPDRYVLSTFGKGEDMVIHPTDWIATGVNGEHWAVKNEIFQKTYKKLPVIPECVNYAIEWFEQNDDDLGEVFRNVYEDLADNWHESPQLKVAETWIINHPDDFARAWIDGYEIAEVTDDEQ